MSPVETGLAFIEGLALIFSPCILPVLPLVLSASADGGRQRPFGIIIGFVLSFSLFAFAARKIVGAFGIDLDVLKNVSLLLLFLFGLVLVFPRLSDKFSQWTQGLAAFGARVSASGRDGLVSGIMIGALIGLVWTPCSGPILATVLVQVIRQQSDFAGYLIILSFAIGAGVPMLIIAVAGREIMTSLGFFSRHAEALRRGFGAVIIAAVVFIFSGVDVQTLLAGRSGTSEPRGEITQLENGLNNPYPAPDFVGIDSWLNSPPLTMQGLKGKVVLVDFWTYSCINCVRTLPYLTGWDKKYRDQGLVIVGVHAPEFEFEKKADNVSAAIAHHGIRYPVALDNSLSTWANFNNRYWPAHYLIDRAGKVVYTHFGEGEYDVTENNIRYLLGLKGKVETVEREPAGAGVQTPETYLGYARAGAGFQGQNQLVRDQQSAYRFPESLPDDHWALSGAWNIQSEKIISGEKDAALRLHFTARKVFLVLGTATGKPMQVTISLNGSVVSTLSIDRHTLYELLDQKAAASGLLEIKAGAAGLEAYAFTFG
ncbi:MAG: cytochrome c biogenesis protein DipZ [Alphaproteobacteria bacterium]|nr:cytochrome c biogenesis protein DipZ [Alphaproteobacteria bacterium]